MNDKSETSTSDDKKNAASGPSELVIGLITFVIFIIFMTVWMTFSV